MNNSQGLYNKFIVERVDGRDREGGDKADARYFVLDYINDSYAKHALVAYAEACQDEYPDLAKDLMKIAHERE